MKFCRYMHRVSNLRTMGFTPLLLGQPLLVGGEGKSTCFLHCSSPRSYHYSPRSRTHPSSPKPMSMSRKLWVRVFHCFEGVHLEVALQSPLLAPPQRYLCRQAARARLIGEDPHHPRPPLYLFKQPLQHVRRP